MDKRKKGKKTISIPKGAKKLHIDGSVWYWKYTTHDIHSGTVVILCMETGKKYKVDDHVLKGMTPDLVEREKHKNGSSFRITPAEIKKYIKEQIRND